MVKRSKVDKSICTMCEADLAARGRERCRKCSAVKLTADMRKGSPRYCKACDNEMRRAYNVAHGDEIRAKNRARYQARKAAGLIPPKTAEQHRRDYHAHIERHRERNRRYYARNAERIKAGKRVYAQRRWKEQPEMMRARDRVYKTRKLIRILRGEA